MRVPLGRLTSLTQSRPGGLFLLLLLFSVAEGGGEYRPLRISCIQAKTMTIGRYIVYPKIFILKAATRSDDVMVPKLRAFWCRHHGFLDFPKTSESNQNLPTLCINGALFFSRYFNQPH